MCCHLDLAITTAYTIASDQSIHQSNICVPFHMPPHSTSRHLGTSAPRQGESQGPFDGTNYLPRVITKNNTRLAEFVDVYGFNSFRIMAGW